MAQWWEHSPPTDVARDRFSDSTQYVGWVCCWLSCLLWEVFLRVLRFSSLLKNQHVQIPIWSRFQWTNSHSVEVRLEISITIIIPITISLAMLSNGSTHICLVGPNVSLSTGNCQSNVICCLVCHRDRVLVLFFFPVYVSKFHLSYAHAYADDTQ